MRNVAEKWIIDIDTSYYFCARKEWYQTYENLMTNVSTAGPSIVSEGVETVRLPIGDHEIVLQNVIHVPEL